MEKNRLKPASKEILPGWITTLKKELGKEWANTSKEETQNENNPTD